MASGEAVANEPRLFVGQVSAYKDAGEDCFAIDCGFPQDISSR